MKKDFLGLGKVEKEFKNLDFKLFNESKGTKKGGGKTSKNQKKQEYKPIMTKKQAEQTKELLKSTGSAFGSLISSLKNRKIRKLEKEAVKNLAKSQALAHKIKTIQTNTDALTDIARYEKQLEKVEREARETKAQMEDKTNEEIEHSQACKDYNLALNCNEKITKCLCENDSN